MKQGKFTTFEGPISMLLLFTKDTDHYQDPYQGNPLIPRREAGVNPLNPSRKRKKEAWL